MKNSRRAQSKLIADHKCHSFPSLATKDYPSMKHQPLEYYPRGAPPLYPSINQSLAFETRLTGHDDPDV